MPPSDADKLRAINAVLAKLAQDEDLHDDFKLPVVKAAIDHWTGRARLDPDKAQHLQNNRRVIYVLQRQGRQSSYVRAAGRRTSMAR